MLDSELKTKLNNAKSLEEVEDILGENSEIDAEQAWKEIERHQSTKSEKLDIDELDAVAGGADRDWIKDGCAATCEYSSWCGSNDNCLIWSVTYDNFWETCPDGHPHEFDHLVCKRCGLNLDRGNRRPIDR